MSTQGIQNYYREEIVALALLLRILKKTNESYKSE